MIFNPAFIDSYLSLAGGCKKMSDSITEITWLNLVVSTVILDDLNCASSCLNHNVGLTFQKGDGLMFDSQEGNRWFHSFICFLHDWYKIKIASMEIKWVFMIIIAKHTSVAI